MSLITRIDARSRSNSSLQIQDLDGNVLCEISAAPSKGQNNMEKFRNEAHLKISASDAVRIVKSNGTVLGKR